MSDNRQDSRSAFFRVKLDDSWHDDTIGKFQLHWKGDPEAAAAIKDELTRVNGEFTSADLKTTLSRCKATYAGVLVSDQEVLAFVDLARSIPIFYSSSAGGLTLGSSARVVRDLCGLTSIDPVSQVEFHNAGYVTGGYTLYRGLRQLQAGQYLSWNLGRPDISVASYFRYVPSGDEPQEITAEVSRLNDTLDRIFARLIRKANGADILIPLSGGLDSRLILAKLHSLGYPNLKTFSYGPDWNYEAKRARNIAGKLTVPWIFVHTDRRKARDLFESELRKEYWKYADGLSSLPVMNDFYSLNILKQDGYAREGTIVVNGQSGDFISGMHIPDRLLWGADDFSLVVKAIVSKHYALWRAGLDAESFSRIERRILATVGSDAQEALTTGQIVGEYEHWELRARQAMLVVNGQRLYEFFGLRWELPLWDAELVRFYSTVSLRFRLHQFLYKQYLKRFNHRGLFDSVESEGRRWPPLLRAMVGVSSRLTGSSFLGKSLSFWGHYADQYSLYGIRSVSRVLPQATVPPQGRGLLSLGVVRWEEENLWR